MVSGHGADPDDGVLADWSIPRRADQVTDARHHVRKVAEKVLGYGERACDVELCAAETITNAVRHGRGDSIRILVCADENILCVDVTDDGSQTVPRQRSDAAESGRGLVIVEALADEWNHTIDPDTGELSVSFEFDIKSRAEAPGAHGMSGSVARECPISCLSLSRGVQKALLSRPHGPRTVGQLVDLVEKDEVRQVWNIGPKHESEIMKALVFGAFFPVQHHHGPT